MRSFEELEELAAPLRALDLSIDERALIVQILGLYPAFCPVCRCTIGSPVCHPLPESIGYGQEPQEQTSCPAPCHAEDDD